MPADILFFGILVCIIISILRYVLDSNLFIRLSHSYDAKLLLAKKSIEWHKRDCKERGVGVDERKLERLQELFDTRQKKFCECCWRIVLYVSFSIYGIACIKKSTLFLDTLSHFAIWPLDALDKQVALFYYLELGLYLHLTINHFFEVKRKDFVEMLLHHVTTLGLILFSWFVNFTRFGVLVMVLHDVSDVFLEVGKICIYMGMDTAKDIIFVVFALTFFVTRLVMYPLFIVKPALWDSYPVWGNLFLRYVIIGLLLMLQLLHIFWFSIIMTMIIKFLKGELEKDERSDDGSVGDRDAPKEE